MAQVVGYPLDDGGVLFVQAAAADEPPGGLGLAAAADDRPRRAAESLQSAMAHVTPALQAVVGQLRELAPDEATVQFHLTLTAETGIVIAKGNDEAHFTVTLAWSKDGDPRPGR